MTKATGMRVTLRPMRADDADLHRAFIAALAPDDLRFRFGSRIGEAPRSERRRMTEVDDERETTFVATMQRDDGACEIVGEIRAHEDAGGARVEFAIAVRSDVQRHGLGRALLEKLVDFCRQRGIRLLYGLVDPA
ncbi:MAG TPA: GNAT family N-acetyltransferase, partial [Casimicrobiaceae bacterium]|nr:GNAT family N-acetyltransferase [Casimicrobiaceae bacterium]